MWGKGTPGSGIIAIGKMVESVGGKRGSMKKANSIGR